MGNEEVDIISVVQKPKKKSLLEKYNIPVDHLSYEFISQCTNAKTLERIVLILRSGEEGSYPDLTRHAEEHLAKINPASVVLRKVTPVLRRNMLNAEERQEIDDDISSWTCKMQSREKDLNEGKATLVNDPCISQHPEIRKIRSDVAKARANEKKRDKPKRISSCDYAAWDKYDADTEINRIDLQDEQRQAQLKAQERRKEMDQINKKTVPKPPLDKRSLTGTEVDVLAAQEREKGNEAFRAADYEEALRHYNASIDIDSNLNAYNNRAMTLIKLQRYDDALNDCNMVLSMDYKNIKGLLRRALSLEHLKKVDEALADYEAVLKLEPTNKTAIFNVNKLRRPCESRKIRMKIEEGHIDDEKDNEKLGPTKSQAIAKASAIKYPKQHTRINNDICYCDRAPSSSRNVTTMPHVKTSYCVEIASNRTAAGAATASAVANRSSGKITRNATGGNKLSPGIAKDFVGEKRSEIAFTARTSEDISMIFPEPFVRTRDTDGSLKKSIFSCISTPNKARPSTVIIEELPSSETAHAKPEAVNSGETKTKAKRETEPREERNTPTREPCVNKGKKLSSPGKKSPAKTSPAPNRIEPHDGDEEKPNGTRAGLPRRTRMEMKKETSLGRERNVPTEKSNVHENDGDSQMESKSEASGSTSNKIYSRNEFHAASNDKKLEMDLKKLEHVKSPYEFLRLWQSLKDDANLALHARLLRLLAHEGVNKIIGNKLDATMFSLILRCLEQQFCTPQDADLLVNLLCSLSQLNRFSIICMFMDSNDKRALENILRFLEKENSPKATQLRQIYVT